MKKQTKGHVLCVVKKPRDQAIRASFLSMICRAGTVMDAASLAYPRRSFMTRSVAWCPRPRAEYLHTPVQCVCGPSAFPLCLRCSPCCPRYRPHSESHTGGNYPPGDRWLLILREITRPFVPEVLSNSWQLVGGGVLTDSPVSSVRALHSPTHGRLRRGWIWRTGGQRPPGAQLSSAGL